MSKYTLAANLIAQVKRAGARHSARDNDIIQMIHDQARNMHDTSISLGAKCDCGKLSNTHPRLNPDMLKAAVKAVINASNKR